jgi:UDP-glucose 4-epimerase
MIDEIMQGKLEIKKVSENNLGHYKITPYVYHPAIAKKLVANPFIDIGQGIVECIQTIYKLKSGVK